MTDEVNNPSHYNQNGIEVIDVIETYAKHDFRLANVLKYVCRAGYKGQPLQDLQKAQWYLNRVVDEMETADALVSKAEYQHGTNDYHPAENHHEFVSSLASRIAGEDEASQQIKDEYYKFDRYEIQGYCANCDKEIAKGQPYIRTDDFDVELKFCKMDCVKTLKDWQKDWSL